MGEGVEVVGVGEVGGRVVVEGVGWGERGGVGTTVVPVA